MLNSRSNTHIIPIQYSLLMYKNKQLIINRVKIKEAGWHAVLLYVLRRILDYLDGNVSIQENSIEHTVLVV